MTISWVIFALSFYGLTRTFGVQTYSGSEAPFDISFIAAVVSFVCALALGGTYVFVSRRHERRAETNGIAAPSSKPDSHGPS